MTDGSITVLFAAGVVAAVFLFARNIAIVCILDVLTSHQAISTKLLFSVFFSIFATKPPDKLPVLAIMLIVSINVLHNAEEEKRAAAGNCAPICCAPSTTTSISACRLHRQHEKMATPPGSFVLNIYDF